MKTHFCCPHLGCDAEVRVTLEGPFYSHGWSLLEWEADCEHAQPRWVLIELGAEALGDEEAQHEEDHGRGR